MAFDEASWASFLSRELGFAVRVRFGRARQRVLEARPRLPSSADRAELDVRMNAFFGDAPPPVREAVARWLRAGRRARRAAALLDQWIAESVVKLPPPTRRVLALRTLGRHHDILALAREVAEHGDPLPHVEPLPAISWGKSAGSRPRHSLQLGSYVREQNLVRIHPVLDREWVPGWFVRYILFHELLHAAMPPAVHSGRTIHHGAEFRRRERQYPDFTRALAWQEANLARLLRDARRKDERGSPPPGATRPLPQPIGAGRAGHAARKSPEDEAVPAGTTRQGLLFSIA